VPGEIWDEAAKHYAEPALAALVTHIAAINTWNRLNVTTPRPGGRRMDRAMGELNRPHQPHTQTGPAGADASGIRVPRGETPD